MCSLSLSLSLSFCLKVRFIQGHSTRISVYVHVQRTVTVSEGWRVGVYLCVIFIFIFIFEMGVEGREGKGREGEARGGERRRGDGWRGRSVGKGF